MPQKLHKRPGGYPFLDASYAKRMAQDMWSNGLRDSGPVCYSLDSILDSAHGYAESVLKGKVTFQNQPHTFGHRNHTALCFLAVWITFTINDEPPFLPLDIGG